MSHSPISSLLIVSPAQASDFMLMIMVKDSKTLVCNQVGCYVSLLHSSLIYIRSQVLITYLSLFIPVVR